MGSAQKAKSSRSDPSFLDLNKQALAKSANSTSDWQTIQDNYQKDQARQARISQNKKELKAAQEKLLDERFLVLDRIEDLQTKILSQKYLDILNQDMQQLTSKLNDLQVNLQKEEKILDENNLLLSEMAEFVERINGRANLAPELQNKEKEYQSIVTKTKPIIDKLNKEKNHYQNEIDYIKEQIDSHNQKKAQLIKLSQDLKKLQETILIEFDELENKKKISPLKERINQENLQNKKILQDLFSRPSIIKLLDQGPRKELVTNIILAFWQSLVHKKRLNRLRNIGQRYNEMLEAADALSCGLELDELQSSLENIKKIEDNSVRYVQVDKRAKYYQFCRILLRANILKLMLLGHISWPFKRIINLAFSAEFAPLKINCQQKSVERLLQGKGLNSQEENIREKMNGEMQLLLPAINKLIAYLNAEKQLKMKIFSKKESDFNDLFSKAQNSLLEIVDNLGYILQENSPIMAKELMLKKNLSERIKIEEDYQSDKQMALSLLQKYLDATNKVKKEQQNDVRIEIKLMEEKTLPIKKQLDALREKIQLGDDSLNQLNAELEKLNHELEDLKNKKSLLQKKKKDLDNKVLAMLKKKKILQDLSEVFLEIQVQQVKIDEKENEKVRIKKMLDYDKNKIIELEKNLQYNENKIQRLQNKTTD